MTNPKVSKEKMLSTLDYLIECTGEVEGADADPELREGTAAIRAALADYFRLRKKVGEWSKKMEKYFVEGRISIPCRAIDWNKMTEFFKEIRDFGEGK